VASDNIWLAILHDPCARCQAYAFAHQLRY
jgi:hypothetical protein